MGNRPTTYGKFATSIAIWILMITIASVLIAAAIVIGLTELTGSATAALLIGAAIFLLLAVIIYLAGIRTKLCKIEVEMNRAVEVIRFWGGIYDWTKSTLSPFLEILFPKRNK